jgi:imidazolonepropionase-like amidohydrolase
MGIDAGRLTKGKLADLLIVDGDPLADITLLRDPVRLRVFKGGGEIVAPLSNHHHQSGKGPEPL